MLAVIEGFQSLSPEERQVYRIGRRARYYNGIDDLNNPDVHRAVEQMIQRLSKVPAK